jgi:general secretion pathway protein F
LLAKAGLPLPDGLRHLAEDAAHPQLREALGRVAASVEQGRSLCDAMAEQPGLFPPLHRRVVAAGEDAGVLPDVLLETAQLARLDYALTAAFRDAAVYPVGVILFATGVFLFVLRFVLWRMPTMFTAVAEVAEPPVFSRTLFAVGHALEPVWPAIGIAYAVAFVLFLWLLVVRSSPPASFQALSRHLPGVGAMEANLDMARLCGVWSVLVRRDIPLDECTAIGTILVQNRALRAALESVTRDHAEGRPLRECFERQTALPQPVCAAWARASVHDLPGEFAALRDLYMERAQMRARRAAVLWESAAIVGMAIVAALVIVAMFLPLIDLQRSLLRYGEL